MYIYLCVCVCVCGNMAQVIVERTLCHASHAGQRKWAKSCSECFVSRVFQLSGLKGGWGGIRGREEGRNGGRVTSLGQARQVCSRSRPIKQKLIYPHFSHARLFPQSPSPPTPNSRPALPTPQYTQLLDRLFCCSIQNVFISQFLLMIKSVFEEYELFSEGYV